MIVTRHTQFRKNFKKRIASNATLGKKFQDRLSLFITDRTHSQLQDHRLIGKWQGFRAFSVTGDIRVIYRQKNSNTIELYDIGTHNQVY